MSYEAWRISFQSSEQAARAAYDEITSLRADLAASQAECERLRQALMCVQNFPGHPGGHTADASADADDAASWRHGWICAVEAMQEHATPRQETE